MERVEPETLFGSSHWIRKCLAVRQDCRFDDVHNVTSWFHVLKSLGPITSSLPPTLERWDAFCFSRSNPFLLNMGVGCLH